VKKEPLTHSIRMLLWGRYPESSPMREVRLISLLKKEHFPVMNIVAWGEERRFGFPINGFFLAQQVPGDEMADIYQRLSFDKKKLLFKSMGRLVANLHAKGFFHQVRLTDLIARYEVEHGEGQYVLTLIDRETGKPWKSLFFKQKCINSLARALRRTRKQNLRLGANSIRQFTTGYLEVLGKRLNLSQTDLRSLVYKKMNKRP
jgi:tRNA A-37 threonylcarbamoyl transferase component Bud32